MSSARLLRCSVAGWTRAWQRSAPPLYTVLVQNLIYTRACVRPAGGKNDDACVPAPFRFVQPHMHADNFRRSPWTWRPFPDSKSISNRRAIAPRAKNLLARALRLVLRARLRWLQQPRYNAARARRSSSAQKYSARDSPGILHI